MVYVVVETYKPGKTKGIYNRLRERGRLMPEGVECIASWVTLDHKRCYQVMKARDLRLLEQWTSQWKDLVDFEVIPVESSEEAARAAMDW